MAKIVKIMDTNVPTLKFSPLGQSIRSIPIFT